MKIIFNCHTEYDLNNQHSFAHLAILLNWFRQFNLPMTFSLAVGQPFQNRLLQYAKGLKFPEKSELAIHFHSTDYQNYLQQFKEIFNFSPKTMVFGKWQIDKSALNFLSQQGIAKDGSFVEPQKIIGKPFLINNIWEVPVVSFQGQPVNPLTKLSHFFLLRKIIKEYHQQNLLVQIGFHSYNFFSFAGQPRLRWLKKIIFKNLLNLIKKNQLAVVTLKEIEKNHFSDLEKLKTPLISRFFNLLGH